MAPDSKNRFSRFLKKFSQERNVALLCLLVVLLIAETGCRKATSPAESAPAADDAAVVTEILDKYVRAVGGEEAIKKIKSYQAKGSFATSLVNVGGTYEVWGKDPNKTLSVIGFPGSLVLKKGFDGETRWVQTPAGTLTDPTSNEMAEVERDADIYRAGKIKSLYESMRLEGKARLNGRDVQMIEGKPAKGPTDKLFFDSENGLLLRWDMVRRDPRRGNVFVKVFLDDYREADGVKVPFKVRFGFESFDLTLIINELKHNVPVDDAMFRKP